MEDRTEYVTWVTGIEQYRGPDLPSAIRAWDSNPSVLAGGRTPGGISVQTWQGGYMVRDGWILHVYDNGQVFLNPNLRSN